MKLVLDASPEDLKVFLEEADEQLELLDRDLILLEQDPVNESLIQEIFRAAHTLKGSSATIGHHKMAELTHRMEDALDRVRKGLLVVDSDLVTALLQSLDGLRVLRVEIESGEDQEIDLSLVLESLHAILDGGPSSASAAPPAARAEPVVSRSAEPVSPELLAEANEDTHLFHIAVEVASQCPFPAARLYQVVEAINQLAVIRRCSPSLEDIEAAKTDYQADIVVASPAGIEQIRGAVAQVSDVEHVEAKILHDEAGQMDSPSDGSPGRPEVDLASDKAEKAADERATGEGAQVPGADRRVIDLGAEARGKSQEDMLRMAAEKMAGMSKTVRIDVARLDGLLNLAGELVIDRNRLSNIGTELAGRFGSDELIEALGKVAAHLGRITDELQEEIMKSRMLPIENVFHKFPRMVRDLARNTGKKVNLTMEGQDTELDRSVIEVITDPLVHLLRNSVDHGIEKPEERIAAGKPEDGTVKLSARHMEGQIIISVEDDGKGIDPQIVKNSAVNKGIVSREAADRLTDKEALGLIFMSGLSTAQKVSEISGRGVGLDIVRANIEKLNGSVSAESQVGSGTTFIIRLPLTLAIVRALLARLERTVYAIPLTSVTEIIRVGGEEKRLINKREAIQLRGEILPLMQLSEVLRMPTNGNGADKRSLVVAVRYDGRQVGLVVDSLVGEQEIVIKPLGKVIGNVMGISGAAILADGSVAPILDVPALVRSTLE